MKLTRFRRLRSNFYVFTCAPTYTLVEIRKCLERTGKKRDFRVLSFFCDRVVHVELNKSGADDALSLLDSRLGNLNFSSGEAGADEEVLRFMKFDRLLDELKRFCAEMRLPPDWTVDPTLWYEFVRYYGEVVRDCPLTVNRSGATAAYIRTVVLRAMPPQDAEADKAGFKLQWELTSSNGNRMKLGVELAYPRRLAVGPTETSFGLDP